MGKGWGRRPSVVGVREMSENWTRTFGGRGTLKREKPPTLKPASKRGLDFSRIPKSTQEPRGGTNGE